MLWHWGGDNSNGVRQKLHGSVVGAVTMALSGQVVAVMENFYKCEIYHNFFTHEHHRSSKGLKVTLLLMLFW